MYKSSDMLLFVQCSSFEFHGVVPSRRRLGLDKGNIRRSIIIPNKDILCYFVSFFGLEFAFS